MWMPELTGDLPTLYLASSKKPESMPGHPTSSPLVPLAELPPFQAWRTADCQAQAAPCL